MHLTHFERLILSMRFRELAEAEPEIAYYEQSAEILESGYTSLYSEVFGSTSEEELDQAVQEEVIEILTMFRAMHPGHEAGPDWNPDGDRYDQKFRGFDGNAGTGHYGFGRFLIQKMGRFEESNGELNSHSDNLGFYRNMLSRWRQLGKPHKPSEEQIDQIIGKA